MASLASLTFASASSPPARAASTTQLPMCSSSRPRPRIAGLWWRRSTARSRTRIPGTASAHTVKASFEYHVGDALIQSLGFPAGNQAVADNGDVVTIVATGTFDALARTATGGGTFVHDVAATGQAIT